MARADGSVIINTKMDTKGFKKGIDDAGKSADELNDRFKNLGATVGKIGKLIAVAFAVHKIVQFGKKSVELAQEQQEAERKLETVMRQRMGATNEAIDAIKEYTAAQQELGVVGDEVQMAGAQQLSTFLRSDNALKTLIPAMNDLAVQQNGVNVTSQNMVQIGNLMGKVMQGQTAALRRVGITFSDAEEHMLKYGTEEEKAATLAKVITNNVGAMNKAIANTPAGQIKQLKINLGDVFETIGMGIQNFLFPIVKVLNTIVAKMATLANAFKSFSELITGKKSSGQTLGGSGGIGSSDAMYDLSDATDETADSTEGLANAQKDNAKATKQARKEQDKYLSGLDEIRRYESAPVSDNGTTKGGTGALGSAIGTVDYGHLAEGENVLEKTNSILDKLIDKFKELKKLFKKGFWDGLGDYKPKIDSINASIASIKKSLKDVFTDKDVLSTVDNFAKTTAYSLGQIAGAGASIGLTLAQLLVGGIADFLSSSKDRIKNDIISMFEIGSEIAVIAGDIAKAFANVFSVFGQENGQKIVSDALGILYEIEMEVTQETLRYARDILNMIATPFIDNQEVIKTALDGTLGVVRTVMDGIYSAFVIMNDAFRTFYDQHLKPLFDSIADGLSQIFGILIKGYNTYIVPILQYLATQFAALMQGPFGTAINSIYDALGSIVDVLRVLWEEILVPFLSWITETFMAVLGNLLLIVGGALVAAFNLVAYVINNVLKPAFDKFKKFLTDTIIPKIKELGEKFDKFRTDVLNPITEHISGVFMTSWRNLHTFWQDKVQPITETLMGIMKEFYNNVIVPFAKYIIDKFLAHWKELKRYWQEELQPRLEKLGEAFKKFKDRIIDPLTKFLENTFLKIFEDIATFLLGDGVDSANGIGEAFSELWNNVLKPVADFLIDEFSVAFRTIENLLNDLIDFITNIFAGNWSAAWSSIVQAFADLWDGLVDFVKKPINAAIRKVNEAIQWINSKLGGIENALSFDIGFNKPNWMGGGRVSFALNMHGVLPRVGEIPYLATGAVIPPNAPFTAVLGDQKNGTNIEAPLDTIKQAVREVVGESGGGNYRFTAQINRRTLFDEIMTEADLRRSQSGINPFEMG